MESFAANAAVVTGASSGIGEAVARVLASEGVPVALVARRADRLAALESALQQAGGKALAVPTDITDRTELAAAAGKIRDAFGPVGTIVNCAGLSALSTFRAGRREDWRTMIDLNLTATIEVTATFLEDVIATRGDIVTIGSVSARKTHTEMSVYSATKWGLQGWSEALRQELAASHVRVVFVSPGAVRTEGFDRIGDSAPKYADSVDGLRGEDVAACVLFALRMPGRVSVNEIIIRPTLQHY